GRKDHSGADALHVPDAGAGRIADDLALAAHGRVALMRILFTMIFILGSGCGFTMQKTPTPVASAPGASTTASYVLNASVQPAAIQVLATHCESCHGTENMGGLDSILDPNHLLQLGLIVPGNPDGSV